MSAPYQAQQSALSFCPVLDEIVRTREVVGRSGKKLDTLAVSTRNNLIVLRALHLEKAATRTLEIGLRSGGSALVFAQTHKDLGNTLPEPHVALDPYQRRVWNDESGLVSLERAGLRSFVDFREQFSCQGLPELLKDGARFQIIYIDGSHLFEDAFVDFYYSIRLLEKGGVILFDDCRNRNINKVIRFIRSNFRALLAPLDLSRYREPGALSSLKYRIADRLDLVQLRAFEKTGESERSHDAPYSNF